MVGMRRLPGVHSPLGGFWKFPETQNLNSAEGFMHNHNIFIIQFMLKPKFNA